MDKTQAKEQIYISKIDYQIARSAISTFSTLSTADLTDLNKEFNSGI